MSERKKPNGAAGERARSSSPASAGASGDASRACSIASARRRRRPARFRGQAEGHRAPAGSTSAARSCKDVFRGGDIEAVVHLGVMHDPRASSADHHSWNVEGFGKLLEYVAQFDVPKLVVLSSANVYGPQPHNPQFLTEEAPLLGGAHFSEIRDLVEVDMLAQSFFWKHPGRADGDPAAGAHPRARAQRARRTSCGCRACPTLLGYDPMVQVIHEARRGRRDRARALAPGVRGIFNLAGPEPLPLSRILRILGRPTLPVPYSARQAASLNRLWSLHLTSFPAPELDHIRYVCMVDDRARARACSATRPTHDAEETVRAVDDEIARSVLVVRPRARSRCARARRCACRRRRCGAPCARAARGCARRRRKRHFCGSSSSSAARLVFLKRSSAFFASPRLVVGPVDHFDTDLAWATRACVNLSSGRERRARRDAGADDDEARVGDRRRRTTCRSRTCSA